MVLIIVGTKALQLYTKATTLDPSFADAYAADARAAVYV
jgi:hypothetical protein